MNDTFPSSVAGFEQPLRLGNKRVAAKFVIPSGIRCTNAATIESVFQHCPSVGIVTTKSISHQPRAGYREPIYAWYSAGSYINAVGLANPGAVAFGRELERIEVPPDRFLLVSIFGANSAEFVEAARILAPVADGFELNMSCPHADGYGTEIGHVPALVGRITQDVCRAINLPVFVKLPVTSPDLEGTARIAIESGASGITTVNTVGPSAHFVAGKPILANTVGGLSGEGIRPLALNAVRRIRGAVGPEPIIIGMGGATSAEHVEAFAACGANLFGIGSALTGMDLQTMQSYFAALNNDVVTGSRDAERIYGGAIERRMVYQELVVRTNREIGEDLFELTVDDQTGAFVGHQPGQFYFLSVPGTGEKPFALYDAERCCFIIKRIGPFTKFLAECGPGQRLMVRGPYGKPLPALSGKTVVLVGGGMGTVPLYEIGRAFAGANRVVSLIGAKTNSHLFDLGSFEAIGAVHVATEDGSLGRRGLVTELLCDLIEVSPPAEVVFVNSGPEAMVMRAFEIERDMLSGAEAWGSIAFMTSCGVGICGKCSTPSGLLSCVDGHFMPRSAFQSRALKE